MNKQKFLAELKKSLSALGRNDIEDRLAFYGEMIDDRIEEGFSESEAVLAVGSADEIAAQILESEAHSTEDSQRKAKHKKRLKAGEIALLIIGCPLWVSLGIAAFSVVFSLYASLWSAVVSLWAVLASLLASFIGGALACVILCVGGSFSAGIAMLALGIACLGLSVFIFYGCKAATRGSLMLGNQMAKLIKRCFVKKEVE